MNLAIRNKTYNFFQLERLLAEDTTGEVVLIGKEIRLLIVLAAQALLHRLSRESSLPASGAM
jgi:hypothetical protein